MKRIKKWLANAAEHHQQKALWRSYSQQQMDIHTAYYAAIAIALAAGSILLQAMWFMYSHLK